MTSPQSLDSDVIPEPSGIQFVRVLGQKLEYLDLPSRHPGRPELLLLHEGLGSVSLWRDFPARLSEATGCRTVAYSRQGFGGSSPRATPYTPRFMHEEALQVVPELRARLGLANPVLVGHSTGASMSLVHAGAGRWPVAAVVAMAPLVFVEESNLASIRAARTIYETTGMRGKLARHHRDVDAVFRGWIDIWLDPAFRSFSIAAEIAGIRAPLLAILGEDDEYCTPAQIERLAASAVNTASFESLRLADCGHSPHRDRPEAVLEAMGRLLGAL